MATRRNQSDSRLAFDRVHPISSESYSSDKPNAAMLEFIQKHARPVEEDDDYTTDAFANAITTTKATATYNIHTYPSKKPHDAISSYIRHYTSLGAIVLDPFCGSGGTALASLLQGRAAIAIDRSPAATFIARNYCTPTGPSELARSFKTLARNTKDEMEWLYGTRCDRCDGYATVGYTVYSQVFECPRCLVGVPLFDCSEEAGVTANGKPRKVSACPHCLTRGHVEEISSKNKKLGSVPVVTSYICESGCKPKRQNRSHRDQDKRKRRYFEKYDLSIISEIESKDIPHWTPPHKMMNVTDDSVPWGAEWRQGRNFRAVADLFTKRNLWALAAIRSEAKDDLHLLFALTGICLNTSVMVRESNTQFMQGTFYIPQVSKEVNVWSSYSGRVSQLVDYQSAIADVDTENLLVSTQSATDVSEIPNDSIDYIFTDPPYSDTVQYGELNFIWESWLDLDTHWHDEEIIVNKVRGRTEADWALQMKRAVEECFRVLKPGRWMTLCYHDTSEGTWALIQDVMAEVGFIVDKTDTAVFIDTGQKSYNQYTADKATKRDLVLNFRKPKPGDWVVTHLFIPADADVETFQDIGRQVIRDYLIEHPGASKDRVYDDLVSKMVRRGEMEAHDFDGLLRSVAEEITEPVKKNLFENKDADLFGSHVVSRWYLKETADKIDGAEQDKENSAADRLEKFMLKYLAEHPEKDGVHYSDVFEQVVVIPVEQRPRRLCENWLPEYFFKTTEGTWRPPTDEVERQQKAAIREAGTLRRMKRFANALLEGVPVRDQDRPDSARTLAEWIRQCRRAGLYEQGRVMYEKGGLDLDRLDEDEQIEVEDDYRICVKRGSEEETPKKSKGRKKKS